MRTVGGGVVKSPVGFPTNDNSASHRPCILIARFNGSHQKDVEKLLQSKEKLQLSGHSLVYTTITVKPLCNFTLVRNISMFQEEECRFLMCSKRRT